MRGRNPFVGVAVALSAAAIIALAGSSAPLAQGQGVISPPAGAGKTAEEIESYWTPDRMRDAKPVPMPQPDDAEGRTKKSEAEDGAKGRTVAPDERPADAKPGVTPSVKPKTDRR
jgi:hypothetical protein